MSNHIIVYLLLTIVLRFFETFGTQRTQRRHREHRESLKENFIEWDFLQVRATSELVKNSISQISLRVTSAFSASLRFEFPQKYSIKVKHKNTAEGTRGRSGR